jgi:hypothetical protein
MPAGFRCTLGEFSADGPNHVKDFFSRIENVGNGGRR